MFTLKALLTPHDSNLPLVNISAGPVTPRPVGLESGLAAWKDLLTRARSTPDGRIRIALAGAIAQLPDWVDGTAPRPDGDDDEAIAGGWLPNIRMRIGSAGTFSFMCPVYETSAGGNFSWNVGVDYRRLLTGKRKRIIERLYRRAGLDLKKDLEAINRTPRIAPDSQAAWFLQDASVNLGCVMGVPVLTMQTMGDPLLPVTGTWALQEATRRAGYGSMLRMTFTEAAGHCSFSVAENLAMVETMKRRLDSGRWDNAASPMIMNQLGESFNQGEVHLPTALNL